MANLCENYRRIHRDTFFKKFFILVLLAQDNCYFITKTNGEIDGMLRAIIQN